MFIKPSVKFSLYFLAFTTVPFFGGCATGIRPSDLTQPEALTCIEIPKGVEAHETKGLLNYQWTTRLVPGPYIAEREDAEGIYYRAPSGGIYIGRDDIADQPPVPFMPRNLEGGIWVPSVPGKFPHLYTYFSTQEANIIPLPENAGCSNAVVVRDPQSKGVSTVAFATGGALGGATGGLIGRAITPNSSMSYGRAAGAGAAGGAIGGLIVAGLINMDVGKIFHHPLSTDLKFVATLEGLARKATPIPAVSTQPHDAM